MTIRMTTQERDALYDMLPDDEHVAYEMHRYTDEDGIDVYRTVMCGEYDAGGKVLCDVCLPVYEKLYPQGWSHYPGDVCVHGVYTGGCGVDWMCGHCEMGETEPYLVDRYRVMFQIGDDMAPLEMRPFVRHVPEDESPATTKYDARVWWGLFTVHILTQGGNIYRTPELADAGITTYVVHDQYTEWREPTD